MEHTSLVRPERVAPDFAEVPVAWLDVTEQHSGLDVWRQQGEVADLRQPGACEAETFRCFCVIA